MFLRCETAVACPVMEHALRKRESGISSRARVRTLALPHMHQQGFGGGGAGLLSHHLCLVICDESPNRRSPNQKSRITNHTFPAELNGRLSYLQAQHVMMPKCREDDSTAHRSAVLLVVGRRATMISVCGVAQESIAGEPRNSVTTGRSCARR